MGRDVPPASLAVAESRSTLRTTPRMADTATMKKLLVVVALAAGCYGPRPQAWVGSPELVESVPVARTSTRSRNDDTCVAMLGRKQRERLGRRVLGSLGLLLTVQGGVRIALGDWSYPNWWGGLVFAPFSILFGALLTYLAFVRRDGQRRMDSN